jgi:ketosteroid isomerase-like protein
MAGSFAGAAFTAASRYTHVFVRGADTRWRLASAQGSRSSSHDESPGDEAHPKGKLQ